MTLNLKGLGSRAIVGAFFKRLEEVTAQSWVARIANQFTSDQESETYKFLSDVPALREWNGTGTGGGARSVEQLVDDELTIRNKKFTGGLDIDEDDFRRDKTGQIEIRINELATRAAQLPQKILSAALNAAASTAAYDGTNFFGSHTTRGGTVNNQTTSAAATGTTPTSAEASDALLAMITRLVSFVDDAGEPRNADAKRFVIMAPPVLWAPVCGAISNIFVGSGQSNTLLATKFAMEPIMNARLTATDKIYLFNEDSDAKALAFQDEVMTTVAELGVGSDWHTMNDSRRYFVKRVCNGALGRFDQAIEHTFT